MRPVRLPLRLLVGLSGIVLWVLFIGVQGALADRVIRDAFAHVEEAEAQHNLDRAAAALQVDLDHLGSMALEWATWDDPYELAAGIENEFVAENMHIESLERLGASELLIRDLEGRTVSSLGIGPGAGPVRPSPAAWSALAARLPASIDGYAVVDGVPYAIVQRPLRPSAGERPSTGTLLLARSLPGLTLPALAKTSAQALRLEAPGTAPPGVRLEGQDRVAGRWLLRDVEGQPAALLVVEDDRPVHQVARSTARALLVMIGVGGLLLLGLLLLSLEIGVLRPLYRLVHGLGEVGRGAPAEVALPILEGSSELHTLSAQLQDAVIALRGAEEAERRRALAEQLSAARGAFLARMSHELRTPLNGVLGMMELLGQTPLSAHQREMTEAVRASAHTLLLLINDVLDLSKVDAGRLTLEPRPADPVAVITDVITLLRPIAAQRGLPIRVALALPPLTELVLDPLRLRQIALNLLGNAIKFTARGEIEVRLGRGPGGELLLAVQDTGPGVPEALAAQIFDPFVMGQAQAAAEGPGGTGLGSTGLGLSICRELAGLMGGRLWLESEVGVGSTFTLALPWVEAPAGRPPGPVPAPERAPAPPPEQAPPPQRAQPRPVAEAPPPPAAPPPPPGAPRVLLVDDHPTNRAVAQGMLDLLGCAVDLAEDGAVACARLATGRYDVVLMDVHMPVMDGLQATAALRVAPGPNQRVQVIAVTASVHPEERARCAAAGMDAFLSKPLTVPVLAEALSAALDRAGRGGG